MTIFIRLWKSFVRFESPWSFRMSPVCAMSSSMLLLREQRRSTGRETNPFQMQNWTRLPRKSMLDGGLFTALFTVLSPFETFSGTSSNNPSHRFYHKRMELRWQIEGAKFYFPEDLPDNGKSVIHFRKQTLAGIPSLSE